MCMMLGGSFGRQEVCIMEFEDVSRIVKNIARAVIAVIEIFDNE